MKTLNCIIVDDEYLAIKVLEDYCTRLSTITVINTFKDPVQALAFLKKSHVDVVFLDIQMPHITGFELLDQLDQLPIVIMTTARHDYAVKAFEVHVLDYLVKPFSFDRFEHAVARAREYSNFRELPAQAVQEYIMIRADHRIHKIMTGTIEYVEGLSEYIRIYADAKVYITHMPLKDIYELLPKSSFLRIHKSFIVAKRCIQSHTSQSVTLSNKKELPVGRSFRESFKKSMS